MNKKLLNEDIKNMKYLFGYKPGRVISEQDYDYTTDDYLDVYETELDEDIFDGWDDPDNFKSIPLKKHRDLEDYDFEFLPDEDNNYRDEMTEDSNPDLYLRRRMVRIKELIDKYIKEVEDEGTFFNDEFEFADNIISWVVQDLTTSDYTEHDYDELTDLIRDEFGFEILSQYVEPDFDEDDDF